MNKKKILYSILMLLLVFSVSGCVEKKNKSERDEKKEELNISQMQSICELATLECYYHNTAKFNSEKEVLFWDTSKTLWVEYSGIVKMGVDFSELRMEVTDNVVTIGITDAKVLSCNIDETSLSKDTFYSETNGFLSGEIGAEEQTEAFKAAQEGMLATAQKDEALLLQAKVRAQTLIENYVKNIGDAIGVDYIVKWESIETTDSGEAKTQDGEIE